jgi:hypothetical protein
MARSFISVLYKAHVPNRLNYALDALLSIERPRPRTGKPNLTTTTTVLCPVREMAIVDGREFAR